MLKFLTHKLRTHSLNEDNVAEKVRVGTAPRVGDSVLPGEQRIRARHRRPSRHSALTLALLQVEERDSGTESDDEAERAAPGECTRRAPTHHLLESC